MSKAPLSKPDFQISLQTIAAQASASDPAISAWVSANAGSGKTTVLVRRVLRLMLAGVGPSKIVCLTYTKAAAANMKIRLFDELRAWASMPDAELSSNLSILGGSNLVPPTRIMARARTLFATALETPGGLKIDTIHGFCTRLLQSVPFEANVPSSFEIVQDAAARSLSDEAVRDVLLMAARGPETPLGQAMARIAQDTEETRFADLTAQMIANRAVMADDDGVLLPLARLEQRVARALDVGMDETEATLAASFMALHVSIEPFEAARVALAAGSTKDVEQSRRIASVLSAATAPHAFEAIYEIFFTQKGTLRGSIVTVAFARADPASAKMLQDMAQPFEAAFERLSAISCLARTLALTRIANAILTRIETLKARRRLLDFEDIILRTRSLLTRVDASWVLYRLDAGIDHVLIDEAQDTSGAQWDIIKAITGDFFAGSGAKEAAGSIGARRTVFAVGDEKQSIYSFQKAEPASFDEMRAYFSRLIGQVADTGHQFQRIQLDQSFRSTREVMQGVDLIFKPLLHHKGLVFEADIGPPAHSTARLDGIGSIDMWPLEADDIAMERMAWDDPVDAISSSGTKLALRIANVLKRWTLSGFDDLGRPFRPGDVLILLRKRSSLFQAVVRELKQAKVPVAGVDRLDIASHVAVEDMLAIAEAAMLPEDDLTLAAALKTPVHGLDDTHLLRLAPERTGSLREAIQAASGDKNHDGPWIATLDKRLSELERRARLAGPFSFFARLLGPEGARKIMLARLGAEAGDALDAFLSMALDYERKHGPSLRAFLIEMRSTSQEIKRDLADDSGEVRVMTVHGAKGLEAPVVIIPDLGEASRNASRKTLFECATLEANAAVVAPVWVPRKSMHCGLTQIAKNKADEADDDERRRLFYVALTRAKDRIILCGANAKGKVRPGSWYEMALIGLGEVLEPAPAPDRQRQDGQKQESQGQEIQGQESHGQDDKADILRFQFGDRSQILVEAHSETMAARVAALPDWVNHPAPTEEQAPTPVSPSRLSAEGAAASGPSGGDPLGGPSQSLLAGQLAHRLLQHLPAVAASERPRVAATLAARHGAGLDPALREQIAASSVAVLDLDHLKILFGPTSLAEVAISGQIILANGQKRPVAGRIDRLAVAGDTVWIADFKTSRAPASPDMIKPATLRQIAAYHSLVAAIYPASQVRSLVVYLGGHGADTAMAMEPAARQRAQALADTLADEFTDITPA